MNNGIMVARGPQSYWRWLGRLMRLPSLKSGGYAEPRGLLVRAYKRVMSKYEASCAAQSALQPMYPADLIATRA